MKSIMMVYTFILLISLVIVSGTVPEKCDNSRIMNCMKKFNFQEIVEMMKSQEMETLNTEHTLDKFCSFHKKLGDCVKDIKNNCKSPSTLTIDTTVNAGRFLCSEGKQVKIFFKPFFKEQNCEALTER
ncbi:uncharacterized protein LOC134242404 [Saccostrea cucullata]|uniref:uncharacterized protein LOC134242404 n=1 Tax=Saccostrea cuccullata TaxID=36930 RepID=UPI002ED47F46